MLYILLLLLFSLFIGIFFYFDKDILAPPAIVVITFGFCTFLASLYSETWNLPMHVNTVCIILGNILMFCIGSILAKKIFFCKNFPVRVNDLKEIKIPNNVIVVLVLMLLFFIYLNYTELYFLSHLYNPSNEISVMLYTTIYHLQMGDIKFSKLYIIRLAIAQCISYIFIYVFMYNKIFFKHCHYMLILPSIFYIGLILLTGGRQEFLYFIIFLLVSMILLYQYRQEFNTKDMIKIYEMIFFCFGIFLILFIGTGMLSGKIHSTTSIIRVLSHYAGTNITALDVYINKMYIPANEYIGEITLPRLYNNLNILGFNLPTGKEYIKVFVEFDGITTNVYTALRRYIQDYGYIGCMLIMFLLGTVYTSIYMYLKYRNKNFALILLYAAYCYPIFLFCREERFMTSIISGKTILIIFFMYILFNIIKEKGEIK